MAATMRSRGPDGEGSWTQDRVALAHRRLKIIDLTSTGDQPMTDHELGLTWPSTAASTTTRSCVPSWSATATASSPPATPRSSRRPTRSGAGTASTHFTGHVRLRALRARVRAGPAPGSRPARSQAAVPGARPPDSLRFASTLPALLAGGGIDTELDAGRTAPLPELAFGRPATADDPQRRPEAAARDHDAGRARREQRASERYWRADFSRQERYARLDRRRTGQRPCSRRSGPRSSAAWSPMCRSASCSPADLTRA